MHNFWRNAKNWKRLHKTCLNAYADQRKFRNFTLRWIEQDVCSISHKHTALKIKFDFWNMKKDPTMWTAAVFECRNVPTKSTKDNCLYANQSQQVIISSKKIFMQEFKNSKIRLGQIFWWSLCWMVFKWDVRNRDTY